MRTTQLLARRGVVLTAALVAAVGGATAGGVLAFTSSGRSGVSASGHHGGGVAPAPPVQVGVHGLRHGHVAYGHRLQLDASDGRIAGAVVTEGSGRSLEGTVLRDGAAWQSKAQMPPDMEFTATVQTVATDGSEGTVRVKFHTTTIGRADVLSAVVTPDGGTYGVGMPVVAYFSHDVPLDQRAAVEKRFHVTSTSRQVGAWHWMDSRTAHWRPARLWKAHAKVSVRWDLAELSIGHGVWGERKPHDTGFRIGDSHVSTVDVTGHYMAVRVNGSIVKLMPTSTGRDQYASKSGPHIVLSKQPVVIMDSATVGIPKGNPDYYYEKVYWDTRLSNGGMFVHAAPWSVADQGIVNVSHGCVNVSPDNAKWFYYFSLVGDVVNVIHSPAPPVLWDPGTADWTISWRDWLAGDPAHPHLSPRIHTDPALLAGVPVPASAPPPPPPPATTSPAPSPTHTASPTVSPSPTRSKRH